MKKIEITLIEMEKSKGWLAKEARIAPGTLSNILKGSIPTLSVALKISKVLNTTVEDLWGDIID